jgi:hypothetical protein
VIDVKSGKRITRIPGVELFDKKFSSDRKLLVGTVGIPFLCDIKIHRLKVDRSR